MPVVLATAAEQEIIDAGGLSFTVDLKLGIKLGIKLKQNPDTLLGVAIKAVTPDGLAGTAGAEAGDVIGFLNGVDVRKLSDLSTVPVILGKDILRLTLVPRGGALR
jgi:C-terminal processing protease CtpA/Prc